MLAGASADRHSGGKSSQRGERRVGPTARVARPSAAEGPVPLNDILLPALPAEAPEMEGQPNDQAEQDDRGS